MPVSLMIPPLSSTFGDFAGRAWLNTAHQGAIPRAAVHAAHEAIGWKRTPHELTMERFEGVPRRLRSLLGALVHSDPDEIVLANSASYGLHAIANAYPWAEDDEVLVTAGDFPSDILPWLSLEPRFGVSVRRIRPSAKVVAPGELERAITPRTRLFCAPWVHSFSGCTADLDALGEICRRRGVYLVVNASQALGARPIDVGRAPIDALVSAGFKWLCGPYGTGFAWIRPSLRERLVQTKAYWLAQLTQADLGRDDLDVVLERGTHDLDVFGTANFNNFVPWIASIESLLEIGLDRVQAHDDALVAHLIDRLHAAGAYVESPEEPAQRSTLVFFSHPDRARNQSLHRLLAGAGVDVAYRAGSLRASPHLYNGTADIDRLVDGITELRA
jgi:cysteine desulfurase / selenocysteine lyase